MSEPDVPTRIGCLRSSAIPPLQQCGALFERAAASGLDALLLPSPFEHDGQGALLDTGRLAPAYQWQGEASAGLQKLAVAARRHRLRLLLDLRLDRFSGAAGVVEQHPDWFRTGRGDGDPPDPRLPAPPAALAHARLEDPRHGPVILDWWQGQLEHWLAAGIDGFRCMHPQVTTPAAWRRLIEGARRRHPACCFLAWTPGVGADEVAELAQAGFDAAFASLPWWDFHAHWFFDEHRRLRRFDRVLMPVDDPQAPEPDDGADPEQAKRRRDRAFAFAAAAGDGLLLTLDPHGSPGTGAAPAAEPSRRKAGTGRRREARTGPARLELHPLPGLGAITALFASPQGRPDEARLVLVNRDDCHLAVADSGPLLRATAGPARFRATTPGVGDLEHGDTICLEPAELRAYVPEAGTPVTVPPSRRADARRAAAAPRVVIEAVAPSVDDGRFAVKRMLGGRVVVEADIYSDGHDAVAAELLWRPLDQRAWQRVPMRQLGNDRWRAEFALARPGRHVYTIEAWRDEFATLRGDLEKKRAAGTLARVDVDDACARLSSVASRRGPAHAALRAVSARISEAGTDEARLHVLLEPGTAAAVAQARHRPFLARHPVLWPVDAERRAAGFGSWYELFPRSMSGDTGRHGTFDDVIDRLPAIRDMGFDVLYMPPIHPIGRTHRKGRNNSTTAEPGEPGSPYAIGSPDGGHDALHPELGTLEDFLRLRDAAAAHGLELALDFAIQCSPDHPWLREHPDWFDWRADGTIRYAENPPKKYQDIVNVDFYAQGAVPSLWRALRDVVAFWVDQGVRLFRVDNPHTKPFAFWEWLIEDIRGRDPGVVFLSEAFTRPKVMYQLAKLGFSQSYTYFTWRNGKRELADYLEELNEAPVRDFFRPHFFVNTPDINPVYLQRSGRPGHLVRAALATTLSGLWGMYSGFELCEATPLEGKEEYLDSEKYQLRAWDWQRPGNIVAEITRLNDLRRRHPALQTHLGVRFLQAGNDQILYYAKRAEGDEGILLVAVNLDPHAAQEAHFEVPLWEFGLPDDGAVDVVDLWTGRAGVWHGKMQHLRLDPALLPFAIWHIQPTQRST